MTNKVIKNFLEENNQTLITDRRSGENFNKSIEQF